MLNTVDVTDIYSAVRKQVFETCNRITVQAKPGEVTLMHRHLLHGVDPWPQDVAGDYRMIAYFRPEMSGGVARWMAGD